MKISINQVQEFRDHQGAVKEIGMHPSGRFAFARSDDMLVLYDMRQMKKIAGFYDSSGYDAAIFDPGGEMLVYMSDEKLHYWDITMHQDRIIIPGELMEYRDKDLHNGIGYFVDGNNDGSIDVRTIGSDPYDPPDFRLEGHSNYIEYLKFHPSGKILASGSADMTLRFWDMKNQSEISSFKVHDDFVTAICFTPDGTRMLSGDYAGRIKVWDFSTSEPV